MGGGAVAAPALIYSTLYTRQVFKKQNKTKHDFAQMEGKDTLYVCLLSWPDGLPGQSAMDYRFFILPGISYLYCPVYCHGLHVCFYPVHSLPICDPVPLLNRELISKLFLRFRRFEMLGLAPNHVVSFIHYYTKSHSL